jgi:hypothetical protein
MLFKTHSYAGIYESLEYRKMVVTVENNSLVVKFGDFTGVASHYHRDEFDIIFIPRTLGKLNFEINQQKEVTKFSASIMGEKMSFTKIQ